MQCIKRIPYCEGVNRKPREFVKLSAALLLAMCCSVSFANEDLLRARIVKLESALDSRGLLDLANQLESLQREVQELRGQLEEQQYSMERLRRTQRESYVDMDQRLQRLQPRGPGIDGGTEGGSAGNELRSDPPLTVFQPGERDDVAGEPAPEIDVRTQPPQAPSNDPLADRLIDPANGSAERALAPNSGEDINVNESTNGTTEPRDPEGAYRHAFSLLKAGQYEQSIDGFNAFLLDFPDSTYADNAQYWLGETYFVQEDYTSAIEQYQILIRDYPNSKKRSHAMLKVGYSYHKMGQADQARAVLEDLRTRFSGTTAARLATERLQQIAVETSP